MFAAKTDIPHLVSLSSRVIAYGFMIMFTHLQHTAVVLYLCSCLSRWASTWLPVSLTCHIQSCSGYCRARARRPCLMGTASGFIRACSASRAARPSSVSKSSDRLRPSERSVRSRYSGRARARAFAAALRYSLFVRNVCYSAELQWRSRYISRADLDLR